MFDVSVTFDKSWDKLHTDVLPLCHLLFTTVPVKLLLHGLLLYGPCQVNVLERRSNFYRSLSMSEQIKMISQAQLLPVHADVD